ncbi:MAG: UDP-glucuronic acid decarboxylase family protein [Candidatus Omnitrophota bacterium]|nr:SDR family oxidoreductase [Candidatus Omnitrophota bacterium]
MNILITGGAGFIGSHLCKMFLARNHKVMCVDNFITGSRANIEPLLSDARFVLLEHDISVPLFIDEPIDWVLHFASIASPNDYLSEPIKTLKSGLLGTHNCLGIAKAKKAKFFLASTSEIYGDPLIHPQREEYWGNVNSIGVRSCYDESKRGAEALTYAYHRQHNLRIRVIRIFNTYGPHMQIDDGRVVSNFIVQALRGKDITIYGKGTQTRSFCYIDDLTRAIAKLMNTGYELPVNIGNSTEFTITRLAHLVLRLTHSKARVRHLALPEDDPKRRKPDITKAKKILGWKPIVTLEAGLLKTIAYFEKKLHEKGSPS